MYIILNLKYIVTYCKIHLSTLLFEKYQLIITMIFRQFFKAKFFFQVFHLKMKTIILFGLLGATLSAPVSVFMIQLKSLCKIFNKPQILLLLFFFFRLSHSAFCLQATAMRLVQILKITSSFLFLFFFLKVQWGRDKSQNSKSSQRH